jgi:hypothetical protein
MTRPSPKAVLEQLRLEREIVVKGGYGKIPRLPWKTPQFFRDSVTCLNYEEVVRKYPCADCFLMDFVPESARATDVPCHHIPLNETGDTISSLETGGDRRRAERVLHHWLEATIRKLEASEDRRDDVK